MLPAVSRGFVFFSPETLVHGTMAPREPCLPPPPIQRMDLEKWLWTTHKIRIRGGEPSKLRFSTPY